MRKKRLIFQGVLATAAAGIFALTLLSGSALAKIQDVVDSKEETDVVLYRGDLVSLQVYSLTQIAVSDPSIVDVASADVDEVLLIGRKPGETPVFIWDEFGKRMIMARVLEEDLDIKEKRMSSLVKSARIKGVEFEQNGYEGELIAKGDVLKYDMTAFDNILDKFGKGVINLVEEKGELIQFDIQVSELSTTLVKALGFDWSSGAQTGLILKYEEQTPTWQGNLGDWFRVGDFERTTAILATVSALITEGKGRVLSKPSIVVKNAEEAEFLVGGEIPIRTTTTSEGNVTETISYTPYGISVKVTPEIRKDKVHLDLSVEVRDIDASNSVGENVAFTTRSADTYLVLNDGQTIVMAGLIKHNESQTVERVPFLSNIPILGALFRYKNIPANADTEVVISVTPHVISLDQLDKDQALRQEDSSPEDLSGAEGSKAEKDLAVVEDAIDQMLEENDEMMEDAPPDSQKTKSTDFDMGVQLRKKPLPDVIQAEEMDVNDEGVSQTISRYVQAVQEKIAKAISFPYEGKEKGWKGTVELTLKILSDGTLDGVKILKSSGHDIFDQDALNTAEILAPYDAFPAELDLEELVVTVPVVYSQEAVLGDMASRR